MFCVLLQAGKEARANRLQSDETVTETQTPVSSFSDYYDSLWYCVCVWNIIKLSLIHTDTASLIPPLSNNSLLWLGVGCHLSGIWQGGEILGGCICMTYVGLSCKHERVFSLYGRETESSRFSSAVKTLSAKMNPLSDIGEQLRKRMRQEEKQDPS